MPPNPKVVNAFRAMKDLGISEDKVKPVLKNLLKLYDKEWELIETENYRLLVDTIFENEELEAATKKKAISNVGEQDEEEAEEQDDFERPLKRLRLKHQQGQSSQSHNNSTSQSWELLIVPKDEPLELPEVPTPLLLPSTEGTNEPCNGAMVTVTQHFNSQPLSPFREACIEDLPTGEGLKSPKRMIASSHPVSISKEEPLIDDLSHFVVPLAVVHPETRNRGSSHINSSTRENHSLALVVSEPVDGAASNIGTGGEHANLPSESSSQLQITSSPLGEVKLCLIGRSDFHMSDIDTVVKLVEDKCLRSYKILDPEFSVMKLMKDMCECFLQLGSEKSEERTQTSPKTDPSDTIPAVVNSPPYDNTGNSFLGSQGDAEMSVEPPLPVSGVDGTLLLQNGSDNNGGHLESEQNEVDDANCKSLVVVQEPQPTCGWIHSLGDVIDICKGHERIAISVVNDVNDESPPSFHYIPKSLFFHNAYVNFSLALIGENDCSSHCVGDCLSRSVPCACAHETGEFAYTAEGLVEEEFLEECVSMNRDPEKQSQFFCDECPLERSKNEDNMEPCKGHLVRKFIKECWWKCGCNKQCGNRVVQRGITRKIQVFMTKEKGWGLRTLEDIPKGAFVCEYVGEVLTNAELFHRLSKCPEGEEHSYPVLLDADWGSKGVLKDKEALCLDATYYGNVARFINHRCFDSTLVEIPVEIETPDHHYYHLAFFASRDVKAMEELTWDYGIDLDDDDHPVKAFDCQCGSRFCRNMKRPKRSRFSGRGIA